MSIYSRSSAACTGCLAVSVLILGTAAPASVAFARGLGSGHFSAPHAMTSVPASHALPTSARAAGQMSAPSTGLEHGSPPNSSAAHHHHHPSPPSGGKTGTASTVVTSPSDDITFPPLLTPQDTVVPSVSAPAIGPTTAVQQSQVPDTSFSTGGTLAIDQHPGGGGDTLAACMSFWQPDTTMTKAEWHDTCVRTLNGLDSGGGVTDNLAATTPAQGTHRVAGSRGHRAPSQHHAHSLTQSQVR